jgi:hypothetical protein
MRMVIPPAGPEVLTPSQKDNVPLEGGQLHEKDLHTLVEKIYQMIIRQLRLENEREGRIR